jgi:hypothetical protein
MSHVCEQLVDAARYLQASGMSQRQLSEMHHFSLKGREISFSGIYSYFGENKSLKQNNANFAARIIFIANDHRHGRGSFDRLIETALSRWPL